MQVMYGDGSPEVAARRPTWLELCAAGLLLATVILHLVAMFPRYFGGSVGQGSIWSQPDQAALYAVSDRRMGAGPRLGPRRTGPDPVGGSHGGWPGRHRAGLPRRGRGRGASRRRRPVVHRDVVDDRRLGDRRRGSHRGHACCPPPGAGRRAVKTEPDPTPPTPVGHDGLPSIELRPNRLAPCFRSGPTPGAATPDQAMGGSMGAGNPLPDRGWTPWAPHPGPAIAAGDAPPAAQLDSGAVEPAGPLPPPEASRGRPTTSSRLDRTGRDLPGAVRGGTRRLPVERRTRPPPPSSRRRPYRSKQPGPGRSSRPPPSRSNRASVVPADATDAIPASGPAPFGPYGARLTLLVALLALVTAGAFLPAWDRYVGLVTTTGRTVSFNLGNAFSGPWPLVLGNVLVALALVAVPIVASRLRDRTRGGLRRWWVRCWCWPRSSPPPSCRSISRSRPSVAGLTPAQAAQLGLQLHMSLTGWFTLDVLAAYGLFVAVMVIGYLRPATVQENSAGTWATAPEARSAASLPWS